MNRLLATSIFVLGTGLAAVPAMGQTIDFEGTRENVNPLSPPGTGRCSPPYFNTVEIHPGAVSSTGTSNVGTFVSDQSHCIDSPPPTATRDGEFTYTFAAGDTITGTYTGNVTAGSTPGVFDAVENLVVTGGTGRFAGATGTITGSGALAFANGNGTYSGALTGSIVATATTATGNYAAAYGEGTAALGDYSSAFGGVSIANGANATALGGLSQAIADGATAVGGNSVASGINSTALGAQAGASAIGSSALGNLAQASGPAATAVGHRSNASGMGSAAVGVLASASGFASAAVGRASVAGADQATAVGAGANAAFAGSTALGAGATTTAANQVTIGGTGSAVRIGDIDASTAAQSGPIGLATVDANGVLGRDTGLYSTLLDLQATTSGNQSAIGALFDLRSQDRKNFEQGIAAATAMGNAAFPSAPGKVSYVLNGAMYRGRGAVGGSMMYRFNTPTTIAFGLGFAYGGGKNSTVRAGVAGEF